VVAEIFGGLLTQSQLANGPGAPRPGAGLRSLVRGLGGWGGHGSQASSDQISPAVYQPGSAGVPLPPTSSAVPAGW
jgi:hypothetical protein